MTPARVVFAGTPAFALASLQAMLDAGVRPCAVYTQPDRPSGRGRKIVAGPVKVAAAAEAIPVYQPTTLVDPAIQAELATLQPDLIVVAAYGLIFPRALLDTPRLGCLNVHASLLPRWRGAAPIQSAILSGDARTGISLMQMEAGLDSGPVFACGSLAIGGDETAGELHDRLARLGGALLVEHLPDIVAGSAVAVPQDPARVTHAGKISAGDALLRWQHPAGELSRRVRAFNPVPGARFDVDGEPIKCWRVEVVDGHGAPGTVVGAGAHGIDVACGSGVLRLCEVQRPGRRRVSGAELARQLPLAGRVLGNPSA